MQLKNNEEKVLIYGKAVDVISKKPLSSVQISIGCTKALTSIDGEYSLKVDISDVRQYIKASTVGYKMIKTNFLNLKEKTKFKIDFFLQEDDGLIIDCD